MPIIIKDIEWTQTESKIVIKIPLRGVPPSKANIFYSPRYIQVSFEQYFFEALLLHPVNSKESSCTLTGTHIVFELIKRDRKIWNNLEIEATKSERQEMKKRYLEEEHSRIQNEQQELKTKKSELKRLAVREQMGLDAKQREEIEAIKRTEKDNALKDMDIWKEAYKVKSKNQNKSVEKPVETTQSTSVIPPPRSNQVLNISFTQREFPTPCRESRLEEENEWLRKQAEARRSVGFISDDLHPEEHNPQFLKHKGDEFLRKRNYLAAVSAYTFGLKLNSKFVDLYVGRAEAQLALGNYNKTVQDCSTALELLKPEVSQNLKERAACIGWRGIALINLGLIREGIGELKASVALLPNEDFSTKLNEAINKMHESDQ